MMIGHYSYPGEKAKLAQGPKSKALHFEARVCAECNGARTQSADREFDRINEIVRELVLDGKDPNCVFDDDRYSTGSEPYLNVFRYFAKLLCCHLAVWNAPRPLHMARFALGQESQNCVWLNLDHDWVYRKTSAASGHHQYAAHGGLVVYGDKSTGGPNAFHSTLTLGPIRYIFHSRLTWLERLELRLGHRDFYNRCRQEVRKGMDAPLSEVELLKLGLTSEELLEGERLER